jgi:hypothetical protein
MFINIDMRVPTSTMVDHSRAEAPEIISTNSIVILACLALL